ncbi:hypothetical protein CRUP_005550 [Coryphaenoides rupestris]|nr:hypothetical protein CRUP_005550 [Coryphaenoides rupestris]
MTILEHIRSPRLSFAQTAASLALGGAAIASSYWCVGRQKVPKPLCSPTKRRHCVPVPGLAAGNGSATDPQFSWDTGDDRFVFPAFHVGLFYCCEENIYTDAWEEKCRGFHTLTPPSEKAMMWLSVTMEIMYMGLLCVSCVLLCVQLCVGACSPAGRRWGQMFNAFAAVFTVLAGLIGMVAHMMFMQVFQTTVSMGPEDFKPHSYGYSWAFYVAWLGFTACMAAGVSTLNSYTKRVLMVGRRFPPAPDYTLPSPDSPPPLSHLSPYYDPSPSLPTSSPRRHLTHSLALLPPPSHATPPSPAPFHRLALTSPSVSPHRGLPGWPRRLPAGEDYSSPL